MLAYAIVFVLGALDDVLAIEWHEARERSQIARAVALSLFISTSAWVPYWFAFAGAESDPFAILASILGSGLGTGYGLSRHKTRQ